MLAEPKCFTRKCRYYLGVIQPDGTELTERNACKAFPDGIPEEIAYGDNPHDALHPDQVGTYTFEPSLMEEDE